MDTMLVMLVAAFFASMGLVALLRPARVLAFFGTPELTRDGRNEVRAVYGGFGLAVAGLLLATFFISGLRHGVIVTVAVSLAGMAMGRLVAAVIDGWPGFYRSLFLGRSSCWRACSWLRCEGSTEAARSSCPFLRRLRAPAHVL